MTKEEYILLFEKCASGNCTKGERILLEEYKDEFSLDSQQWNAAVLGSEQEIENRIYKRLQKNIKNQTFIKLYRYLRPMVAAIIVFALCFGFYFYFNIQEEAVVQESQIAVNLISDSTRVVLTLEDGSQMFLDDLNNGGLVNQTNAVITKEGKGKLKYEASTFSNTHAVKYNSISIPRGVEYQLILPDGTRVWLNSESSLKFPIAFTGNERKVELSGEAYFEVAKNKEKPFRVIVKETEIEVLGTHFNVNAYNSVNTTLLEGSVKLKSPTQEILLKPGQLGVKYSKGGFEIKEADIEAVMAWRNGYFVFRDESIKSIMEKISRWYNIDVEYQGDVESKQLYGKVSRYDDLSELLKNIELTGSVHFKILPENSGRGRRVIVML